MLMGEHPFVSIGDKQVAGTVLPKETAPALQWAGGRGGIYSNFVSWGQLILSSATAAEIYIDATIADELSGWIALWGTRTPSGESSYGITTRFNLLVEADGTLSIGASETPSANQKIESFGNVLGKRIKVLCKIWRYTEADKNYTYSEKMSCYMWNGSEWVLGLTQEFGSEVVYCSTALAAFPIGFGHRIQRTTGYMTGGNPFNSKIHEVRLYRTGLSTPLLGGTLVGQYLPNQNQDTLYAIKGLATGENMLVNKMDSTTTITYTES